MVHFSLKCFIRISLRNLKVKTYNLYENDIRITKMKKSQFSRVLYYSSRFSYSQEVKYSNLQNIIFSDSPLLRQGSRNTIRKNFPGNSNIESFSQRQFSLGRINVKKTLFENSFRYAPTTLNIRYQSTTANSNNATPTPISTQTVEISESEDSPWFDLASDGFEYILKDISESAWTSAFQNMLETVHTSTGLPWWGTIILTTVILRTLLLLPFALQQKRVLVNLENAQRQFEDITIQVKKEISMSIKKFGWPVEFAREKYKEKLNAEWKDVFRRENTHPLKACNLVAVQFSTWLGMSLAVSNMCFALPHNDREANQSLYSEMTSGGLAWIQDLTVVDSSFILPLSVGLLNLGILGVNYMQIKEINLVQKIALSSLSILSLVMAISALDLPSGVVLYWTVSSGYGLMYNLLLTRPGVRKMLRIADVKSDDQLKQDISAWIAERQNSQNMHTQSGEKLTKTSKDV